MEESPVEEYVGSQLPEKVFLPHEGRNQSKDEVHLVADYSLKQEDCPRYNQELLDRWGHGGAKGKMWSPIVVFHLVFLTWREGYVSRSGCDTTLCLIKA